MEEKMMSNLSILVIGGHPADVFDHCGGTLAHHIRRGDRVTALALTQGLRIHDVVISEVFRFQGKRPDADEMDSKTVKRSHFEFDNLRHK